MVFYFSFSRVLSFIIVFLLLFNVLLFKTSMLHSIFHILIFADTLEFFFSGQAAKFDHSWCCGVGRLFTCILFVLFYFNCKLFCRSLVFFSSSLPLSPLPSLPLLLLPLASHVSWDMAVSHESHFLDFHGIPGFPKLRSKFYLNF